MRSPETSAGDLLRTKLAPPHPRVPLLARPELVARLDSALARGIALLAAPAGFGKSTLVVEWLAGRGERAPLAWLTLDAADNDPLRFWRYLAAACEPLAQGPELPRAEGPWPERGERLLTALLNHLAHMPRPAVLALEDYHTISAPAVHGALGWLLERLPATLRVALLTRAEPPIPQLARLRARGALAELRAADLRFAPDEIRALVRSAGRPALSAPALARLAASTEGWPAGVHLALLALQAQRPADPHRLLAAFGGDQQHVAAYLTAEVLDAQPEPMRRFLLETSALTLLTPELCDAVTGRGDGAALLEAAERANLFLVQLEGRPRLYRYHTLFAEAMRAEARRRLGAPHLREICRRASRWYEAGGRSDEAIEAALAAESFADAARMLEARSPGGALSAAPLTLRRWVEQLPADLLPEHPSLCLAYASAILFSEDRAAPATMRLIERPLELAEHAWRSRGAEAELGGALALRAMAAWWQGDGELAARAAAQSIARLPQSDRWWRSVSLMHLGMAALAGGRLAEAEAIIAEARACAETRGNRYGVRAALLVQAAIVTQRGELDQAEQLLRQIGAEAAEDADRLDESHVLVALAELAVLRGDLGAAERMAAEAIDLAAANAEQWGARLVEGALRAPALLVRARAARGRGALDEARAILAELAALLVRGAPDLRQQAQAEQARLSLALGDTVAVQRWAAAAARRAESSSALQQERDALVVARWMAARGDPEAALRALGRWRAAAQADERALSELEIGAVSALAHAASGRHAEAQAILAELLPCARSSGARQILLDEGKPMRRLLLQLRSAVAPGLEGYLAELLASFPATAARASADQPLRTRAAEPLSAQEQRVLRLLGAGLSNPEIAAELVVSVNTIKTQVQSIYRKLGITSRREARALLRAGRHGDDL